MYYVEKDPCDNVARKFLDKLPNLRDFLFKHSALTYEQIAQNLNRYKKQVIKRFFKKVKRKLNKFIHAKYYVHCNQYTFLQKNAKE